MRRSLQVLYRIGAIAQAFVLAPVISPTTAVHAEVPAPSWHVADTRYETSEYIIAGYEADDFNITADGTTDVTEKLQKALDTLHSIGGGTLFLPEGRYVIKGTLKIPQGVTLAGDWQNPDENNAKAAGTILMAYSGRGRTDINNNNDSDSDSVPFIMLEPNSEVRGLNIWYPEQTADSPVPYPTTIRMYDPKTWGADNATVRDITFINSYNAIRQGPYSSGCPNVNNVYMTPLNIGVEMDGLADVGRFTNIHVSPDYWLNSELDNAKVNENTLRTYMKENTIGVKLGRIDWSYFSFSEIEGCKHGMEFVLSHSVLSYENSDLDSSMTAWSYPNGQSYKIDISNCAVGLYSEGNSGAGELLAEISITNCDTGIQVVDGEKSSSGNLEIASSVIEGNNRAIEYDGSGRMSIGYSTINGDVEITNGKVSIAGCNYSNCDEINITENANHIILGSSSSLPKVNNSNNCTVTYSEKEYIKPDVQLPEEEPHKVTKPTKKDLFIVTEEPYNAPCNDVSFSQYNTPCTEDASGAIQQALDDAGANGGGIVFCPPGRYTINTPLFVPSGVELRGAVDISRFPLKIGTVFDTPAPVLEYLHTDFTSLNTTTSNGIANVPSGNTIFSEIPAPILNSDGTEARSITATPYGIRLYSQATAEQAHAFDHSTQLVCGNDDSKYIMEACFTPESIKENGEFFITLSRNEVTTGTDGSKKNNNRDAFRIVNLKQNENLLELPGGIKTTYQDGSMYLIRWELDLTDINNKTISSTLICVDGSKDGEILTSTAKFPDAYQGNNDNVGHILLQASKVNSSQYETSGESEVYVHGVSVQKKQNGFDYAWVQLKENSGLCGIIFNTANQKYLPSPVASPYMVQGQGANIYIRNVSLRNAYDGIDFATYPCDNHYIDGVSGIAWHNEITTANSDNGIISNSQFNRGAHLYGSQTKYGAWEDSPPNDYTVDGITYNPRSTVYTPYSEAYMALYLDCITVDNCKNEILYNNFSIFGSSSLTISGDSTALCIGHGADGSRFGMRVSDSADVDFINTQIVSFYYSNSSHITADDGYNGQSDFLNLSAWSIPDSNIAVGGGKINIYNPTFNGVSKNTFANISNDSIVFIQSGWINNGNTQELVTGDGNIIFRDNFFAKSVELPEEPITDSLKISNTKINDTEIQLTVNATMQNHSDKPYAVILAIHDKTGKFMYTKTAENVSTDTNSMTFKNIILPTSDYYKISLLRWNSINGMTPLTTPMICEYHE